MRTPQRREARAPRRWPARPGPSLRATRCPRGGLSAVPPPRRPGPAHAGRRTGRPRSWASGPRPRSGRHREPRRGRRGSPLRGRPVRAPRARGRRDRGAGPPDAPPQGEALRLQARAIPAPRQADPCEHEASRVLPQPLREQEEVPEAAFGADLAVRGAGRLLGAGHRDVHPPHRHPLRRPQQRPPQLPGGGGAVGRLRRGGMRCRAAFELRPTQPQPLALLPGPSEPGPRRVSLPRGGSGEAGLNDAGEGEEHDREPPEHHRPPPTYRARTVVLTSPSRVSGPDVTSCREGSRSSRSRNPSQASGPRATTSTSSETVRP
uniref:Uncharacterized protein n=1 Tax=uncultured Acidobacteria bacterium Rifle_16ft_4_minimus_38982 TaxID=1665089 RepID=A0A0H4TSY6_9BACT|nr:hypothetical protein [uncultured Acidobacteria bacterium Rifle_16ft_4_minimus_38982]